MPPRNISPQRTTGNFVAEWFGHRVWPTVDTSASAVHHQSQGLCPFLSAALQTPKQCIKPGERGPTGVCTISSDSNGPRQDWLACPYRTLDQHFTLLGGAIRTAYRVEQGAPILLLPVTVLHDPTTQTRIQEALDSGNTRVFLFSADKLGGEVDLPETSSSPGAKVDVSVVELLSMHPLSGEPDELGQHLIYEIQTADFHGSPSHAVRLLRDACNSDGNNGFHAVLERQVDICGTRVEGPNKSNIFKRTIYQMILKIQMAKHGECAGFALVIPVPVWESWLRHLGRPTLNQVNGDPARLHLFAPNEDHQELLESSRAWIFVFDVDRESRESPRPLKVVHRITTSSAALVHYAFQTASDQAIANGVIDSFRNVLRDRVIEGWNGRLRGNAPKAK